jgi:hypothetical protein
MKKKNSNTMFNKIVNSKLVNNKITLYIVALIALITLLGYIMVSEFSAIILFFLIGAIAYSFTKNMTIVLGSSVIVTTIASMSKSFFIYQEGMEGNSDSSGNTVSKSKKGIKDKESFVDNTETEPETEPDTEAEPEPETETETETEPGKGKGRRRGRDTTTKEKPEGLSQLTPSLFNTIPNKDQMQKQLGQASDMEQAYDNLEKIMGKDNIKSISTDTKDLIKQQNDLIKQLKTMTPALNDAMSSIGNLDLSKLTNMFSSATKTLSEMKN